MNIHKQIKTFEQPDVQIFINEHQYDRVEDLALQYHKKVDFDLVFVLNQIENQQKAARKLPLFVQKKCLFTNKNYQQATSQRLAQYKQNMVEKGKTLLDLTAGLGSDAFFLSQNFEYTTLIETDADHVALLKYNLDKLDAKNTEIVHTSAELFLQNNPNFKADALYIDPDRRQEHQRTTTLEHSTPNVLELMPKLLPMAQNIYLKTSPMLDISMAIEQINAIKNQSINTIFVLAENNEVKEILFKINNQTIENQIINIETIHFNKDKIERYLGNQNDKPTAKIISHKPQFLYEPNNAIIKAQLVKQYADEHHLWHINPQTNYLFLDHILTDFQGRIFEIAEQLPYKIKDIKTYLKHHQITQANIAKRNFFDDVKTIRQQLNIKDGGEYYLFFTKNQLDKGVCFVCKKIKSSL